MLRATSLILMTTVVLLIAIHVTADADEPATSQQWEYKVVQIDQMTEDDFTFRDVDEEYAQIERHLNQLGEDRWQLIAMDEVMMVFKRPALR